MPISNTTKFANRYGLNVNIYKHPKAAQAAAAVAIDFANECALDMSSDITWATGGQDAGKMIGFHNPIEGTFKISTQVSTPALLALVSGADVSGTGTHTTVSFDSVSTSTVYYTIEGDTVWQGDDGTTYSESIIIHKALPKRAYNISYNGSGDPVSMDIEFELMADTESATQGKVVTITRADVQAAG